MEPNLPDVLGDFQSMNTEFDNLQIVSHHLRNLIYIAKHVHWAGRIEPYMESRAKASLEEIKTLCPSLYKKLLRTDAPIKPISSAMDKLNAMTEDLGLGDYETP